MKTFVTGSSGLVGGAAVQFFDGMGFPVVGVDNNMRQDFFGKPGDTTRNRQRLQDECKSFTHISADIRDRSVVDLLMKQCRPDLIIHAAAQPSHDLAAQRPLDDFDVNAGGTLNLLEAFRRHAPRAVFIFVSTNKVYGDGPNQLPLAELATRWDYSDPQYARGIAETFPVDQCLHSLFGVSKLAADVMVQEYGRYFGLPTGVFRCGCITGPTQAGVELHGFLNYLVAAAVEEAPYTIFGYQGKQVRDQLHSDDLVAAFWQFAQEPRPGEVYNLGGGKANSASINECLERIHLLCGRRPQVEYTAENRRGDHICYYSDLRKFQRDYPNWTIRRPLDDILDEMIGHAIKGGGSSSARRLAHDD